MRIWLSRARLGLHLVAAAIAVTIARLRRGPLRPRWTWSEELVATGMKRHFARIEGRSWSEQRLTFAAMAIPAFAVPGIRIARTTLGGSPALWVTPTDLAASEDGTLLYLHGGAYLFGSIDEYLDHVARIACVARVRAVAIDYRLAPEHPFPAALDDAVAGYRALLSSGVAPGKLFVAGDSAGGGLATSLLVALRDAGVALPARAVLIGPWVDMAARDGSIASNERFDVFSQEMIVRWTRDVLAGADPTDPRASPARADLHGLPPMLVQVGGVEMLHDQVVDFAARARAAGVDVTLHVWDECIHDWPVYAAVLPAGRRAVEEIGAFVRAAQGAVP
jgi:acetyl esterase/lipase